MALKAFVKESQGGTAVMTGALSLLGIGAAALAVDIGSLAVLKNQMQNYADASAMAAAVHLDNSPGSRERAEDVARHAATRFSNVPADEQQIAVESVGFYTTYGETPVEATTDQEARFIEVRLEPRQVNYLFLPVLRRMFENDEPGPDHGFIHALAVAGSDPFICHAPPLMICDPAEHDPNLSLDDPANAGIQVRLKLPQGGNGTWAPGNFGLLQTPDGEAGASAIQEALASVQPTGCYRLVVDTATGSKTNKVRDGINARFDVGVDGDPAPNVINYPRDASIEADEFERFGDGNWDPDAYWMDRHNVSLPPALAGATRYQVYLYELGLEFARDGRRTIYPVPEGGPPAEYTVVTPSGEDIPVAQGAEDPNDPNYDGEPSSNPASNGQARRLVQVAVLQCQADNVRGNGTYPTNGNFAEFFLTEHVKDPPDAAIYGEFVRRLTTVNTPDFHANVRLVR